MFLHDESADVDQSIDILDRKYGELKSCLGKYTAGGLVVAFSGGVDSGFLLWAAEQARREYGGKLVGLTTNSESMPAHDRHDVEKFVKATGVNHIWRNSMEVENPDYLRNDSMRCYYCKTELFTIAKEVALENNCLRIAYGYNASDKSDIRPGTKPPLKTTSSFHLPHTISLKTKSGH